MPQTVYVVEEDSSIRNVLELILADAGYTILTFENFKGLKTQLKQMLPNLILMDMTLRDGDGVAFCESLKSTTLTSKIPVLMMSAHFVLNPKEEIPCADGFISKPFDIADLLAEIGKYVS
ncbi:MAG: response regulator [Pedobacter sp.]|nr:MAG: response regulator [Pedobacter sp.]